MKARTILTAGILLIFLISPLSFGDEKESKMKDVYYANAIALGQGLSSQLQITITRWTTDQEREELLKTLVEKGQDAMIDVLKKQEETGFLRLPNTLGYRLYYAYQTQVGDKRRIVLATDRPINMAEAWRNGRS